MKTFEAIRIDLPYPYNTGNDFIYDNDFSLNREQYEIMRSE